ncbi:MAG: hypothetical protein ABMA64_02735 [Myxococcota bacterium]
MNHNLRAGLTTAALATAAAAVYGVVALNRADAGPPAELAALRDRLQTFQTLWIRVSKPQNPNPLGVLDAREAPYSIVRVERATGRITLDDSRRYLWDGVHAWKDTGPAAAAQLGPEADAIVGPLVAEILAGFPNTTFVPPLAEPPWCKGCRGWRLDLPFTWDDGYAVLLSVGPQGSDLPTRLQIADKASKRPAKWGGTTLDLWLSTVRWDVRLYPDLSEPETLTDRQVLLSEPYADDEVWEGPTDLPGYHVETTQDGFGFDAAGSTGWVAPTGVELPEVRLGDVTCATPNQAFSAPINIVHALDLDTPGAEYLPGALAAGCPLSLTVSTVFEHQPRPGAATRVQGTMELRDTTTTPPTVLGQKGFDETLAGPAYARRGHDHSIGSVPPTFDPAGLELRFTGTVKVLCAAAGSEASRVAFGTDREQPPTLRWSGCYPELGVVPP